MQRAHILGERGAACIGFSADERERERWHPRIYGRCSCQFKCGYHSNVKFCSLIK